MPLSHEPHWHPANQIAWQLPRSLAPWLTDQGSLTARLQAHSGQQFAVQLLRQDWAKAWPGELRLLGVDSRHKMLVREVVLQGRGEDWVFARSLIPYSSLNGRLKALRHLDSRPLGALLFQDPDMRRDPLQVAAIGAAHEYVDPRYLNQADGNVWGRRSVFYLQDNPLLVSEVFLPAFVHSLEERP